MLFDLTYYSQPPIASDANSKSRKGPHAESLDHRHPFPHKISRNKSFCDADQQGGNGRNSAWVLATDELAAQKAHLQFAILAKVGVDVIMP